MDSALVLITLASLASRQVRVAKPSPRTRGEAVGGSPRAHRMVWTSPHATIELQETSDRYGFAS